MRSSILCLFLVFTIVSTPAAFAGDGEGGTGGKSVTITEPALLESLIAYLSCKILGKCEVATKGDGEGGTGKD